MSTPNPLPDPQTHRRDPGSWLSTESHPGGADVREISARVADIRRRQTNPAAGPRIWPAVILTAVAAIVGVIINGFRLTPPTHTILVLTAVAMFVAALLLMRWPGPARDVGPSSRPVPALPQTPRSRPRAPKPTPDAITWTVDLTGGGMADKWRRPPQSGWQQATHDTGDTGFYLLDEDPAYAARWAQARTVEDRPVNQPDITSVITPEGT